MKKTLVLSLLVIFFFSSYSQVQFESISFDQALIKARETGQMIFLQFESGTCDECNEVADKAFEDKKLGNRLRQGFICIKISPKHPDRSNVANFYDKESFFGSLFISAGGALIHTFPKSVSLADPYFKEIDMALTKAGEGLHLNELEKQRKDNPKNIFLTEQLLLLRKSLYLNTDSLLDEYVSLLPPDSLQSPNILAFIAQQYPVIGSKADMLMRRDYAIFNKAWYTLSLPVRIGINNRIISKSMRKAIRERKLEYAFRVAAFARSTHTGNAQSGNKAYDSNILDYYRETHDTLNYLVRVINYYDSYYMTVNVDSIKKRDSLNRDAVLAKQSPEKTQRGDSVVYKKTVSYSPTTQLFTRGLNEGAWTIYTWTNDQLYLKKALQWATRANEFFENPDAIDTYARLLYKTGNKNEAVQQELKAIDLKKKRGYKATEFEKVLANMQAGKLVIDI
jgi:hypothetical protein